MTSRLLRSLEREETRPLFFDRLTRHQVRSLTSVDHLNVEIDEMDEDAFVDTRVDRLELWMRWPQVVVIDSSKIRSLRIDSATSDRWAHEKIALRFEPTGPSILEELFLPVPLRMTQVPLDVLDSVRKLETTTDVFDVITLEDFSDLTWAFVHNTKDDEVFELFSDIEVLILSRGGFVVHGEVDTLYVLDSDVEIHTAPYWVISDPRSRLKANKIVWNTLTPHGLRQREWHDWFSSPAVLEWVDSNND